MKHCNNCQIDFNTNEKVCPLCQSKLEGKCKSVYPTLNNKRNDLVLKIMLFISIVSIFINCYVDFTINGTITYSLFVILGVTSCYVLLKYILKSVHKDLLSLFYNIIFVVIILLFVWFYFTKLTIIPSLIIPIITIFDLLLSTLLALIFRQKYIRKYIHVIFMNALISLIPVILVFTKITNDLLLAHIAFGLAVISILWLIVFDFNSLKEEIIKMFYI